MDELKGAHVTEMASGTHFTAFVTSEGKLWIRGQKMLEIIGIEG